MLPVTLGMYDCDSGGDCGTRYSRVWTFRNRLVKREHVPTKAPLQCPVCELWSRPLSLYRRPPRRTTVRPGRHQRSNYFPTKGREEFIHQLDKPGRRQQEKDYKYRERTTGRGQREKHIEASPGRGEVAEREIKRKNR
ncbi:hypothetical protein chiPu_0025230 [Chiloscyllium punctatum]|uniref:Uncharacterized protein n=1 Tax=Chiloscyllium punctatum TaxID=137246 RepID=A0A401TFJ6_CHIPU|nr:hypothetical protein [Chiloscyllium punctatum]